MKYISKRRSSDTACIEKIYPFIKTQSNMPDKIPQPTQLPSKQLNQIQPDDEENEEIENELIKKKQRDAQLYWNQWFICVTITMAWLFGTFGFSIAWVVLLAIIVHIVMWGSFSRLLEDSIIFEKRQVHRRKALLHDETAEWLNFILNRWWVFSSASIFSWLKANIEPMINEAAPTMLESVTLKACTLGDKTPFVTSIRAFDTNCNSGPTFSSTMAALMNPNGLSSTAKSDLIHSLRYRLVIQADVGIICPDFQMSFTGKLRPGVDIDLVFEKLQVIGQVQFTIQFSMDAPFPHISKATVTFLEKPKVNFDIKLLRTSEMMSVFGIRDWFNAFIMDILTGAMVDPYRLELNFSSIELPSPSQTSGNSLAEGVLTVTVGWLHKSGKSANSAGRSDDERWCVLRVGNQKYTTAKSCISSQWCEKQSFLVEKLIEDKLFIKIKTKKIIGTSTLAEFPILLVDCFQDGCYKYEDKLQKKNTFYLYLKMQYEPLPPIKFYSGDDKKSPAQTYTDCGDEVDHPLGFYGSAPDSLAGVVYLCIHGADGLPSIPETKLLPNPYCVVYCNSRKIKTTHYVNQTCNPRWEAKCEFLVTDVSNSTVQIVVCNYDISKMADAGFGGLATLQLKSINKENGLYRESLSLNTSMEVSEDGNKHGTITVSINFRPAMSVEHSGSVIPASNYDGLYTENSVKSQPSSPLKTKNINTPLLDTAKFLLPNMPDIDHTTTLNSGNGVIEIQIMKGRELIAKDLNGLSDPFCEIRINQESCYKTCVKRCTLNPKWNETVTFRMLNDGDVLTIVVWDHDTFGKDFLGKLTLSVEDLRRLAANNEGQWLTLNETKSGEIELKCKILCDDIEKSETSVSPAASDLSSNLVESVSDSGKSRLNFYGQGNLKYPLEVTADISDPAIGFHTPDLPPKLRDQHQHSPVLSQCKTLTSNAEKNARPSAGGTFFASHSSFLPQSPSCSPALSLPRESTQEKREDKRSKIVLSKSKPVAIPLIPERKSSLPLVGLDIDVTPENETLPDTTSPIRRESSAYASLHGMRRKMKKTFSHPLRRFRSEANVHEDKTKQLQDRVKMERRDDLYSSCSKIESITSNLSVSTHSSLDSPKSPGENTSKNHAEKLRYYNVHGTVVQATGLDIQNAAQITCRVQLLPSSKPDRTRKFAPKTLAKMKLNQASSNPAFNLEFLVDTSNGIPAAFSLCFEIRTIQKEILASKTITLQELFQDVIEEGDVMRTCLSLSSGATLEVILSHGKQNEQKGSSQHKVSKLLRSWSVHRIGKI